LKSIAVDTNILLVLIVGFCDSTRLGKTKRLKAYLPEDYERIVEVIRPFPKHINIPKECLINGYGFAKIAA
jgi:hypothetical protein